MSIGHEQVTELLPSLVAGELEGPVEAELESHAETCEECGSWLATYRHLEASVRDLEPRHSSAETLAHYAIEREDDQRTAAAFENDEHLTVCAPCRHDVETVEAAILAARPTETTFRNISARLRAEPLRFLRFAAAAALLIAALWGLPQWFFDSGSIPAEHIVSNTTIRKDTVLEARNLIAADRLHIQDGTSVTFRAGQVSLGNGFSVGPSANFIVETTKAN